jgi:hypothetical protein
MKLRPSREMKRIVNLIMGCFAYEMHWVMGMHNGGVERVGR